MTHVLCVGGSRICMATPFERAPIQVGWPPFTENGPVTRGDLENSDADGTAERERSPEVMPDYTKAIRDAVMPDYTKAIRQAVMPDYTKAIRQAVMPDYTKLARELVPCRVSSEHCGQSLRHVSRPACCCRFVHRPQSWQQLASVLPPPPYSRRWD